MNRAPKELSNDMSHDAESEPVKKTKALDFFWQNFKSNDIENQKCYDTDVFFFDIYRVSEF